MKKYCPKCEKEVDTVWSFSRERCTECKEPLDENPIHHSVWVKLGNAEVNRRQVIKMQKLGLI